MNATIFNRTARGFWAEQTLKLDCALRVEDEPRTRENLDKVLHASRRVRERAALPQYHAHTGEVHAHVNGHRNEPADEIRDKIASILRERAAIIWRLQSEEERPDWTHQALKDKIESLSEDLVLYMYELRSTHVRFIFSPGPHSPRPGKTEQLRRICIEANEVNTFGNGDLLLEEAADRLYRRENNVTT